MSFYIQHPRNPNKPTASSERLECAGARTARPHRIATLESFRARIGNSGKTLEQADDLHLRMGDPKATSLLSLAPGCRFYPSEEQLLCYYLSSKNAAEAGKSGGYDLIRELDLYGHDPFDLPESACYSYGHGGRKRHWFCYTVRILKKRRAKSGYWRRQGRVRDVVGRVGTVVLGRRSSFVFYLGNSPNDAVRTDLVLHQYAQVDHVKAAFVLCRILVRSRSGNRISDHGLSSYAEQSACTVRHIGIQHDGFHTPSSSENEVHGDTSVPRKNEMSKYPRLDPELDDRVMTRPVSISRIQSNEQVPASVLGGRNPILLDNLGAKHLHSIMEGDFIELDDLID
ncbi:hypothetical protein ACFX13_043925 [Malus domestica]